MEVQLQKWSSACRCRGLVATQVLKTRLNHLARFYTWNGPVTSQPESKPRRSKALNNEYLAQTIITNPYVESQSPYHIGIWTLREMNVELVRQGLLAQSYLRLSHFLSECTSGASAASTLITLYLFHTSSTILTRVLLWVGACNHFFLGSWYEPVLGGCQNRNISQRPLSQASQVSEVSQVSPVLQSQDRLGGLRSSSPSR